MPARGASFACEVKGNAGEFQVRKVTVAENRGMSLEMTLTLKRATANNMTSGKNH